MKNYLYHIALYVIAPLMAAVALLLLFCIYYYGIAACKSRFIKEVGILIQGIKGMKDTKREAIVPLNINPGIVNAVLKQLEKFENNNKYLKPDLTLARLAVMFKSNPKYVSQIILHYKGKRSIDYVNDLRIDYIVTKLQHEIRYQYHTNTALGKEAGFSTSQHFSKAFIKRTKMSPVTYINELKKRQMAGRRMAKVMETQFSRERT